MSLINGICLDLIGWFLDQSKYLSFKILNDLSFKIQNNKIFILTFIRLVGPLSSYYVCFSRVPAVSLEIFLLLCQLFSVPSIRPTYA